MKELLRERKRVDAVDFELEDYGDEGEPLVNREALPVSITLNLVRYSVLFLLWKLTQIPPSPGTTTLFP